MLVYLRSWAFPYSLTACTPHKIGPLPAHLPANTQLSEMMFIVQGKPRSPDGILKVIKETRQEAMQTATDLLENGMAFVTIIADGRVYTFEEFARTIGEARD